MVVLQFNVTGNNLRRTDTNKTVSVSRNNVTASFEFNSDWTDVTPIVAQFSLNGGACYDINIENNECLVPWEVLKEAGTLSVSVAGGDLITTNDVKINLYGSGVVGGLVPTVASPSVYRQVSELATEIQENYNGIKSIIDTYEATVASSQASINKSVEKANTYAENANQSAETAQSAATNVLELRNGIENATAIDDKAIIGEKLSFIDVGVNKLNEKNINSGFYDTAGRWNNADGYATIYAKVKPNTTYSLWGGVIFQLLYFSKGIESYGFFKAANNSGYVLGAESYGNNASPSEPKLITTPENCAYITVTVGLGRKNQYAYENNIMLVEGDTYPAKYRSFEYIADDTLAGTTDIQTYTKYKNKKILYMGDSITALTGDRSWVEYCNNILKPDLYVNVAVSQARWCDYADTVYDGEPISGSHNNTICNQVEKILRGKDTENGNYKYVAEYADFDIICIALGTNDSTSSITENINDVFVENNNVISINSVDRTTIRGAFRYTIENLQKQYPNAQIFICTPVQGYITTRPYVNIKKIGSHLIELANRMSVEYIDTFECGICGLYENYNENGRDLIDGLHPNLSGAIKIGNYNANSIMQKYKSFNL